MLTQQTLEKLYTMKLNGMAEAFRQQQEDTDIANLSFEERFGLLVDQQWTWKENRALSRRLAQARFKLSAAVEDIDFRHSRGLDRKLIRSLTAESRWVRQHQQIFLLGPTGIGKSFLASALAHKACRDGYTALYTRASQLFRDLAIARADGSLPRRLLRLSRQWWPGTCIKVTLELWKRVCSIVPWNSTSRRWQTRQPAKPWCRPWSPLI